jgi:hypothetical protein
MLVRDTRGFVSLLRMFVRFGMIAFAVMFGRRVMGLSRIFMRFGGSPVTRLSHVRSLFYCGPCGRRSYMWWRGRATTQKLFHLLSAIRVIPPTAIAL